MLFPEEDAPLLKTWIVKRIENTSDADSDVLADYVIALLRHDGDPADVRKLCEEEIPDFLTEEPKAFLDDVFRTITYKSYVPGAPPPPPLGLITTNAARPGTFAPPPVSSGSINLPTPLPSKNKRGRDDREGFDPVQYYGHDPSQSYGRNSKSQRRNGIRGGRQHWQGPPNMLPFPFMPNIDPNNPMEAMMQLHMHGLPFPNMPELNGGGARRNNLSRRKRCKDFDRKGFCSRGGTCPYDHGNGLQNVLPPRIQDEDYDPTSALMYFPEAGGVMNPFAIPGNVHGSREDRRKRGRGKGGKRGGSRASFSAEGPVYDRSQTAIVVENIPDEYFNKETVGEFFSTFGKVVDIVMQPYKKLAIVKYETWDSAHAAHASPKVIFDNRFVKVYWYKAEVNGQNGLNSGAHSTANGVEQTSEMDVEEFNRRQEEAQKQYQEKEVKRSDLEAKRLELEKQQQNLLTKHREETEKLQSKLSEKNGGTDTPTTSTGTEMLRAKLAALEQEAKILGIDHDATTRDGSESSFPPRGGYRGRGGASFRGRGQPVRRRGAFLGQDGRQAAYAQYSLDNRPKTLALAGADFTDGHTEEMLRHFLLNLGEFESVEIEPTVTKVSFNDRKTAEKFYNGLHRKSLPGVDSKLDLSWVRTPLPPVPIKHALGTEGDAFAGGAIASDLEAGEIDEDDEGDLGMTSGTDRRDYASSRRREEERPLNMDYEVADDEAWDQ